MVPQPAIAPSRCLRPLALTLSSSSSSPFLSAASIYLRVRTLSTSAPLSRQKPSHRTVPVERVPEYPYGRFETYKQRNEGLYGRGKIRFGNVVAPKYGNKSRTTWLPNRHTRRLWSPALGAFVRTRVTARVLATIDRLGGVDEYLLGPKAKRVKELGPAGWALRWKIMQTDAVRARFAVERAALGLPPRDDGGVADDLFPEQLAAEGLDSRGVLDAVDAMLAREDVFTIGHPPVEGEDVAALEGEDVPVPAEEGARHGAPQAQRPE